MIFYLVIVITDHHATNKAPTYSIQPRTKIFFLVSFYLVMFITHQSTTDKAPRNNIKSSKKTYLIVFVTCHHTQVFSLVEKLFYNVYYTSTCNRQSSQVQ